jgi:hypothetical protein
MSYEKIIGHSIFDQVAALTEDMFLFDRSTLRANDHADEHLALTVAMPSDALIGMFSRAVAQPKSPRVIDAGEHAHLYGSRLVARQFTFRRVAGDLPVQLQRCLHQLHEYV